MSLSREIIFTERTQVALPQLAEQVAGKDDALALASCQPILHQMFGARLHRLFHLQPETAAEVDRIASDELTVEPRRAVGDALLFSADHTAEAANHFGGFCHHGYGAQRPLCASIMVIEPQVAVAAKRT
jgi:hypothetical protein